MNMAVAWGLLLSKPYLIELFDRCPPLQARDDEDMWTAGVQEAMREFRSAVREKYTEGTLLRLLNSNDVKTRRAAVLALGLIGTMESNPALAKALHDADSIVRLSAADALWELWFRGGTPEQNRKLRHASIESDSNRARSELDDLIQQSPAFAEAYNQRAIWFFKRGELARAVEDCERTLRLNPHHFGAAAGLGQCLVRLGKRRAALRAFQTALEINPTLEHLRDAIRSLEQSIDRGE
jgi:tetratricopeptide (TPR) repeat protein